LKTGKGAPYIGEILETAFSIAKAVIILMTPDDEARLQEPYRKPQDPDYERQLTPQVRQNVLFEAGMAMSKFPERTILIQLGKLRPFSDITGRHTIQLNSTIEKRQDLAQRLEKAGCKISLSGKDWHTAGDFEAAVPKTETSQIGEQHMETETQSILQPEDADITRIGIDNKLLNQLYEQALGQAITKYHDAELSGFNLVVYPYMTVLARVNIYFYFTS